ncbi:MAG: RidA family protein [Firmicutes bacterium]|nr:RidA family protein [Bacillota bacterium]
MKPEVIKIKSEGAVGPYSNAVKYGNLLFVSGQTGDDPASSVAQQTKEAMDYIKAIVEGAGSTMDDIIKCQIFIRTQDDFAEMNEVYRTYFDAEKGFPARICTYGAQLYDGLAVEITAVAAVEE